jgi:7-cyano-7-deazaguanine synthase
MIPPSTHSTIGVLASGGLDSCILLAHLLRQGHGVQPFYVRGGLLWEQAELRALRGFLRGVAAPGLEELAILDLPLADLYGTHWSVDGRNAPDAQSPASAVYLPGRNALLSIKPAIWCAMRGIGQLALATLAGNPFADAGDEFFGDFQQAIDRATGSRLAILRPFARLRKKDVLELGRGLPLELTFSCIVPNDGLHCGRCNKCAERRLAFAIASMEDRTKYVNKLEITGGENDEARMTNDEGSTKHK